MRARLREQRRGESPTGRGRDGDGRWRRRRRRRGRRRRRRRRGRRRRRRRGRRRGDDENGKEGTRKKKTQEESKDERSDNIKVRFEFRALGEIVLPRVSKARFTFTRNSVLSRGGYAPIRADETRRSG